MDDPFHKQTLIEQIAVLHAKNSAKCLTHRKNEWNTAKYDSWMRHSLLDRAGYASSGDK